MVMFVLFVEKDMIVMKVRRGGTGWVGEVYSELHTDTCLYNTRSPLPESLPRSATYLVLASRRTTRIHGLYAKDVLLAKKGHTAW